MIAIIFKSLSFDDATNNVAFDGHVRGTLHYQAHWSEPKDVVVLDQNVGGVGDDETPTIAVVHSRVGDCTPAGGCR